MLETEFTINPLVAIAGRVVEAKTGKVIVGAMVKIIGMPEAFQTRLKLKKLQYGDKKWEKMSERIDCKITALDGYFYFVNLPAGDYVLETSFPTHVSVKSDVQVSNPIDDKIPTTMMDDIVLSVSQQPKSEDTGLPA